MSITTLAVLISEKKPSGTHMKFRADQVMNMAQLTNPTRIPFSTPEPILGMETFEHMIQMDEVTPLEVKVLKTGIYSCEVCNDLGCEIISMRLGVKGNNPKSPLLK